ncbi:MAG: glycine cleavage system protein R [Ectothiorhodospiraceae bacterium]|nr:glycine cleavage system protein R [Chromatiales bacterium]MCP5154983.1 glycine cleavage system protein R [Ectothiorhodospiraceae bacterium]
MQSHLVVSVVGDAGAALAEALTRAVQEAGCQVAESRMVVLGSEFSALLLVTGHWNAIAKLETALARLQQSQDLTVQTRRTKPRGGVDNLVPYAIEVIAPQSPGMLHDITEFFARRGISIEDVHSSCYPAPHTGAPMSSLHMTVAIPASTAIAAVRGDFMDFCDDLNLDAVMAPVK